MKTSILPRCIRARILEQPGFRLTLDKDLILLNSPEILDRDSTCQLPINDSFIIPQIKIGQAQKTSPSKPEPSLAAAYGYAEKKNESEEQKNKTGQFVKTKIRCDRPLLRTFSKAA
jgi:hypothetical protein